MLVDSNSFLDQVVQILRNLRTSLEVMVSNLRPATFAPKPECLVKVNLDAYSNKTGVSFEFHMFSPLYRSIDGIAFYISDNKVILTEGLDGVVPVDYFQKIESWPSRQPIPF
ncbi:hypothetical protein HA466_0293960 [Hirschfeldia incana]|nr:hypothetical protein HA466_0293960 [Hirschfeldia incana]